MEKNPYIFNLSEKIQFTKKGDFEETASFEFKAPTMAEFDLATELSQLVMRATLDAREFASEQEQSDEASSEFTTEAARMLLFASKTIKFSEVAKIFKELATKVGTADGEVPLSLGVLNKLSINDFTDMTCGYIANFIFPSLFSDGGV